MGRGRLGRHIARALQLRCPLCGVSPLFVPARQVRRPQQWLEPLPGCERCGYAYQREPGYWLLATFGINYGASAALGFAIYLIVDRTWAPSLPVLLAATIIPVVAFSLLFIRYAKALFLAVDRYIDAAD